MFNILLFIPLLSIHFLLSIKILRETKGKQEISIVFLEINSLCEMNTVYQFMVDFTLPQKLPTEFKEMLPFQKMVVERFFDEGKLSSYAQSFEMSKFWAIFNAQSEVEVMDMVADMPLASFLKVNINMLSDYSTASSYLPQFSLN